MASGVEALGLAMWMKMRLCICDLFFAGSAAHANTWQWPEERMRAPATNTGGFVVAVVVPRFEREEAEMREVERPLASGMLRRCGMTVELKRSPFPQPADSSALLAHLRFKVAAQLYISVAQFDQLGQHANAALGTNLHSNAALGTANAALGAGLHASAALGGMEESQVPRSPSYGLSTSVSGGGYAGGHNASPSAKIDAGVGGGVGGLVTGQDATNLAGQLHANVGLGGLEESQLPISPSANIDAGVGGGVGGLVTGQDATNLAGQLHANVGLGGPEESQLPISPSANIDAGVGGGVGVQSEGSSPSPSDMSDSPAFSNAGKCRGREEEWAVCDDLPSCMACAPQDCIFGAWMEWFPLGGCTGLCQRKRMKAQTNNECGQPCSGALLQTISRRECYPNYDDCVLENRDCQWTAWSSWSNSCFSVHGASLRQNQRHRTRHVLVQALHNGKPCVGPYNQTEPCVAESFESKDCLLTTWQSWTECSRSCDGGWQARLRRVRQFAENGGATCDMQTLREQQQCNIEPCGSQSCVLSEWGAWQGCDILSPAQEYRSRVLLQPASRSVPCNQILRETRGCPTDEQEPQACILAPWSQWSQCSATCAGQSQRTRQLPSDQTSCYMVVPEGQTVHEVRACGAQQCEEQACTLSSWTTWSRCSQDCGDGIHSRSREVVSTSYHAVCSEPLEEVRPCRVQECVAVDCAWADWDHWSACSCTCGGGTKRRNRVIQQSPRHGGKLCEPQDKGEIAPCATQTCDICVDGRWSEWGSWSACSATCASSYKARHRSVDRHPNFCGKPALGLEDQYEVCTGQPSCIPDRDCLLSEWNPWTGCSCKCFGVRERHRRVEQFASGNGRPCSEASLKDVEPCFPGPGEAVPGDCQPDPARECQMGDWEEWQICSHTCGTGERKRSRSILIPAADNGPPCDDATEEVEPCNTQACHVTCIDCLWSEWSMWSDCSKCGHQRYRHRGVIKQANHCGRKCEMQAAKEVGYCKSPCVEHYCTWSTWQEMGGCSAQCGPSTRLLQRHLLLTTTKPELEVERVGDRGGLCRDARGDSYSGCPVQALSEEECRSIIQALQGVDGVQGAMFDSSRVVKFGARRCFVLVDPGTEIWKQDIPGGWLDTPCIEGKGRGPIASAGSDGADKWMCLTLENRPLASGDESLPCSGEQFYQSTCDSSSKCRDECSPVDCLLTDWSAWSEPTCTELCERTRTVARSNECGGLPCSGSLVETNRCWKNCTQPVDCLMGDWGLWEPSECLASSDQRQRERAVVRAAANGGEPCTGTIRETMGCSQAADAVADCELSPYGEWSACTASCGSGLRTRSRTIEVQASGGGQSCQGPLALLEPCNLGPCPCRVMDAAFSQWEEWSTCNNGMHIRKRKVQEQASCGGKPALGSMTEIKTCGDRIDCQVSPWAPWDECDKSCGGGQQERNRQVTQNPQNGGKTCLKDLVETRGCNQQPCRTTSCEVSEWSAWGECSNSCGNGIHERSRTFTHLAQEGGSGCDMPMAEMTPCSDQSGTFAARRLQGLCPMSDCGCVWRDWSEWSACTCECGGGQKTRNRHIARAPEAGCTPCEPFDKQQIEPCNTQKCEEDQCVDALWSPWQDWEPCSVSCKGGITWRSRKITRNANDCGRPVVGASQQHASCNQDISCTPSVDCEFAEWAAWSACTQECDGVKRRSRQIAVQGAGDGAYCLGPVHQNYPCSTDKGLLEFNSPALYLHLDNLQSKNVQLGQAELTYAGVTKMPGDEAPVNLVVTALSRSQGLREESTGLYGHTGSIDFEAGSEIEVQFITMRQQDQQEVKAKMLMIKFFDIADGATLEAPDGNEAFLSYESQLSSDTSEDGTLVVTSQMPGSNPPKDPMSASPQQEMHAAAILWKDSSRASIKFRTRPGFRKGLFFSAKACWRGDCLVSACGRGEDSVDCVMDEWQSWAPCSVSCGRGQRVRTRKVRTMNSHGGRPCHVDLSATEGCEMTPCAEACQAQDCEWSQWSDWGACDKCGGQMKRFRNVIRPSQCGGHGCAAAAAEETTSCPRKCHELSYCTWGDWRPYGECTSTCGHGIKKRTRMLKIVDEPVKSIIGENILGADDLQRKLVELTARAQQLQASRSRQLAACFAAGFLGLVACVSFGRRSAFFHAGPGEPHYHLAAGETESD
ncbi:HMCN1 [Symbiodinium natans]|uniref:HMCN1 protein n=1 Tax=Symbiodinium natans TaxID=878477 RepID=A0A812U642_9DINO|nr:HMCN1 [Symbiodinium natans]